MQTSPENRECGIRFKFTPVCRESRPRFYPEAERLAHWCAVFDQEGMAPVEGGASAGNLSFRTTVGYVITPTRSRLKSGLSWESFVEVVRNNWMDWEVHYLGANPPSSDSFLHERVYALRRDVNAVLHGHDDTVLAAADQLAKEFDIALTSDAMVFGTRVDAEVTATELSVKSYIIRKGHGFVAVGKTIDEAGAWALKVHRRAREIAGR